MKKRIIAIVLSVIILSGCAQLMNIVQTATAISELTEGDIISGLKEALTIGARNAAQKLSLENGYYEDLSVKIPLPSF